MLDLSAYTPFIEAGLLTTLTGGDDTIRDAAEALALEELLGRLRPVYDLTAFDPLTPGGTPLPPPVLRVWVDLTLYHLYARLEPSRMPTPRAARYAEARQWLEAAASGGVDAQLPLRTDTDTLPLIPYGTNPKLIHR